MIKSFKSRATEDLFQGRSVREYRNVEHVAHKRLLLLDAASSLEDLREVRGNRLEALKADRKGQFSIRVNDQFRVCFRWKDGNAHEVELVDYH